MELSDRIFIALLATLFLLVLVIEWRKNRAVPQHVKDPPGGQRLLERSNIPESRGADILVDDVADTNWHRTKGEFS
jgi:hypothetical protein